jgi:hypothetical protein
MRTAPSFLLLLVALAGCSDGGGPGDGPLLVDDEGNPLPAEPTVIHGTGSITASGPVLAVGGASTAFTVPDNATLLYAELEWDDPVQDLDLALASPDAGMTGTAQNFDLRASGGMPGSPDSPHSLTVPMPAAGAWQASAFANGAGAMADYRVAVTLFYVETAVPAGYTALG